MGVIQAYGRERASLIDGEHAQVNVNKGKPFASSDTVYFTVSLGVRVVCCVLCVVCLCTAMGDGRGCRA